MNTVLITARFALAAVFLVAALTKLADMPGSRRALQSFGLSIALVPAAAVALPLAELIAATLLVFSATVQSGAALAGVLLLMFMGGIGAALRRGTTPDCHCFGQLHSKPAGFETLARNCILAAVAMFLLIAGPGPGVRSWASTSNGATVGLAMASLLIALLAGTSFSLWRENRELTGRGRTGESKRLEPGQEAPEISAVGLDGQSAGIRALVGTPLGAVLVFTSATCGPCLSLLPELARWQGMLRGRLDIHVMATGDEEVNRRHAENHGISLWLDPQDKTTAAYAISGTPSAVAIDGSGHIAAEAAVGGPAIEALIRSSLRRPEPGQLEVIHAPAARSMANRGRGALGAFHWLS
jgi:uncharacterized membrane protein YphA (DoxX/SURF4 family)